MRRFVCLLIAALVVPQATLTAEAQKFIPKTIQFKGAPEYSDEELLTAANLKKGTVLTYAETNDHSKLLMDSGVFEGLTFKFDGVDLIFQITVSPQLYSVHLGNLPLIPGSELDARIHDSLPLYHGKVPAEGTLLQGVIDLLQKSLATQGIHSTVIATPTGTLGSRKVTSMTFSIASPPVRVGSIKLQGVSPTMQAKINRVVDHSTGTPFDTENTATNLEHAITSTYADEGYAAAKAHVERSGDPINGADAVDISYTVTVEEGRVYKLGSIRLPADSLVTQEEIQKIIGLQTASAKGPIIRGVWALISSRYHSKGYVDFAMTPHPEFDEAAGVVNYTVEINPGPVYHLALLKFDNVSDDLRKLLMRNWQMFPGDPFDESYVSGFIAKAQTSDPVLMRTLAGVKVSYDVLADPTTRDVNLIIRLERVH